MLTRDIPREHWVRFFDNFSKQHAGWVVNLEVLNQDIGDQDEAAGLPFADISADLKDGENRIVITVGDGSDASVTRIIPTPQHVRLAESEEGMREAIEIESEDGTTTLVRFRRVPAEQTERQLPPKARSAQS